MAESALVGEGVAAMKAAVRVPVTVKCRIGIDAQDAEASLDAFTETVAAAGADALIVHARKAWLDGLSPKENRDIPPLDYDRVYRLKRAHPRLEIAINGGIASVAAAAAHLAHVDGVMMGRAAYGDPWRLLAVDAELFGAPVPFATPRAAALALVPYIEREVARGVRLHAVTRHVVGLFHAVPGARAFRRFLATEGVKPGADAHTFLAALALLREPAAEAIDTAAA
jgi:tRNA-dihydrouridine synthase A